MAQGQQNPGAPEDITGLPISADFLDFAGFEGIDTKPPRPAVADQHVRWCKNLIPLGPNNIRALPDAGDAFYGAPGGATVVHFDFTILQPLGVFSGASLVVFLSDGSASQININSSVQTTI